MQKKLNSIRFILIYLAGERLNDIDVDNIMQYTDTREDLDGNIKYEGNFTCSIIL